MNQGSAFWLAFDVPKRDISPDGSRYLKKESWHTLRLMFEPYFHGCRRRIKPYM
jgi:hypothetical protein